MCGYPDTLAFLPKSKPWNAPEYHHRGIPFLQAAKLDIYSFGLLCLWVLFGQSLSRSAANLNQCQEDEHTTNGLHPTVGVLGILKKNNVLAAVATECVFTSTEINREQQLKLQSFFTLTLAENPTERSSDFKLLMNLLGHDRWASYFGSDLDFLIKRDRDLEDYRRATNSVTKERVLTDVPPITDLWAVIHPTFNVGSELAHVLSSVTNHLQACWLHDHSLVCRSPYTHCDRPRANVSVLGNPML